MALQRRSPPLLPRSRPTSPWLGPWPSGRSEAAVLSFHEDALESSMKTHSRADNADSTSSPPAIPVDRGSQPGRVVLIHEPVLVRPFPLLVSRQHCRPGPG